MRYFIKLSYDGAGYAGWQSQPNAPTVQERLEDALSKLLKSRVGVVGAGRTDALVNASGYVAHFDYDFVIDTAAFGYKLNAILPRDIVIHRVWPVDPSPLVPHCDRLPASAGDCLPTADCDLPISDCDRLHSSPDTGNYGHKPDPDRDSLHARFSAKRREYTYFLHRTKDPFVERHSYFCPWGLDVQAMNEAAKALLGTHDFSCFEKVGSDNRTSICTVTEAFWAPYTPSHVAIMGFDPACPKPDSASCFEHACPGPDAASDSERDCPRPDSTSGPEHGHSRPDATSDSEHGHSRPDAGQIDGEAPLYLYFRISADRFLRNMVRAVVGTLLEVGRGRRTVESFSALVLPVDSTDAMESFSSPELPVHSTGIGEFDPACAATSATHNHAKVTANDHAKVTANAASNTTVNAAALRSLAGESVPGHALFLSEVTY